MTLSALVVVCLLGKVDLISVNAGPADTEVRAGLTRALGQDKVIDASSVYEYLLEPASLLSMQDFDAFGQAPIEGWPDALNEAWTSGVAYCADIAGPPPWGGPKAHTTTMTSAWCCGQRLSAYLWQRYLDLAKPDRFIAVQVSTEGLGQTLRAVSYAPGAAEQSVVELALSGDQRASDIDAAIGRLLSGSKGAQPRTVSRSLFTPLKSDPFPGPPLIAGLPKGRGCDALPSALNISTPGALGRSLGVTWAADTQGSGAPVACQLSFSEHLEPPRGILPAGTKVTTSLLRCGKEVVSAEVSRELNPSPLGQSTKVLIEKLVARWCH
ncbi:MAG TPA: hypothetical protein VH208_01435 [Myxococcaceae bacterium]|nr:hypothetical protein [Myxococcaceae bacterium]